MKKTLLLLAVVLMGLGMMAQTNTYTKVTSASQLSAGDKVLLVGFDDNGAAFVMSWQKTNNRGAIEIAESGGSITTAVAVDPSSQTDPFEITIGQSNGAWTFFDELNNGYLYAPGGGNYLKTQTTNDNKGEWTLTMDGDGFVPTSNGGAEQNIMRYNVTSTLFGCYKESSTVAGLVYIYKAGGTPTIDPEPSNYPTNFHAALDITKVNLTWTASTGTQLPRGYVVIGSTGNITVPTDGNPVANDTDASDGHVAFNTTSTSVYFEQLTPNTTWHFAIFPYTNSGENIDYKTDGSYPTANVTTQNIECIFASNFGAGLAPFTSYNVLGDQEWGTGNYQGTDYAKMSGYASQANHANEDWLITPDILNGASHNEITIAFMNAYKFDGNHIEIKWSEDYDGMSDPNEFGWVDITNDFEWSAGEYAWVTTNHTLNNMGNVHHLFIAFKYTSTDAAASTWEIAEFKVYTGYDGVEENEAVKFNIYPNPANSIVNIEAEAAAEAQIIDMTGRVVMNVNVNAGENTINVADLANGVYFVKINSSVVKFVKR
jgi:hypothetical protein